MSQRTDSVVFDYEKDHANANMLLLNAKNVEGGLVT